MRRFSCKEKTNGSDVITFSTSIISAEKTILSIKCDRDRYILLKISETFASSSERKREKGEICRLHHRSRTNVSNRWLHHQEMKTLIRPFGTIFFNQHAWDETRKMLEAKRIFSSHQIFFCVLLRLNSSSSRVIISSIDNDDRLSSCREHKTSDHQFESLFFFSLHLFPFI